MRIKIEPKEFFMYAVFLAFSKERPAPEDEAIKAYLDAHELIPKAQGTDRFEDKEFDVMYFGGVTWANTSTSFATCSGRPSSRSCSR